LKESFAEKSEDRSSEEEDKPGPEYSTFKPFLTCGSLAMESDLYFLFLGKNSMLLKL